MFIDLGIFVYIYIYNNVYVYTVLEHIFFIIYYVTLPCIALSCVALCCNVMFCIFYGIVQHYGTCCSFLV